jgi:hypothetical protein
MRKNIPITKIKISCSAFTLCLYKQKIPFLSKVLKSYFYSRYSSSAATGYVAEVRYEGTPVFADVAAPVSERLQQRPTAADPRRPQGTGRRPQQGGRPISKRNENSLPNEFDNGPDVALKFFSQTN